MSSDVYGFESRTRPRDELSELIRTGAGQLLCHAVEAELEDFLSLHSGRRPDDGRAGVIRSGHHPGRYIQTGTGPVTVRIPKVRSRTGDPVCFRSALVPPYIRRSRPLEASLSWLCLKGVSTGGMGPAPGALTGSEARGLSAGTVSRLKASRRREYGEWRRSRPDSGRWVHVWADGIHSGLRAGRERLCCPAVTGVNEMGEKRLPAVEDGIREPTQSRREVLPALKAKGMNAPQLAVADGAMGFRAAQEEIFPGTRQQRCWMHKTADVLNALPKSVQPKARAALHDIWRSGTGENAGSAFDLFTGTCGDRYPKAVRCLEKDRDGLMAFYDFPAAHWQSIRTTNPIESTFATIRHRTRQSRGCLTRGGMLHMIFRPGLCAGGRWRRLRGFKQLSKVVTGVGFRDGIEVIETRKHDNQMERIAAWPAAQTPDSTITRAQPELHAIRSVCGSSFDRRRPTPLCAHWKNIFT